MQFEEKLRLPDAILKSMNLVDFHTINFYSFDLGELRGKSNPSLVRNIVVEPVAKQLVLFYHFGSKLPSQLVSRLQL